MLERDSRRWLDVLFNVTLSYNICRHETTNRVPWTVFHGSPPLQYYYAAEETPFSQLTPYFALQEKRAEITAYVKSRQNSRASKLIEQSEKQLQSNRHGAVRQRKKFEAPLREDPATILEYTKSNRYLVQFQDGTTKHYARRLMSNFTSELELPSSTGC